MSLNGFYEADKKYNTNRDGLIVRSKGEREIANFLYDQQINFEYEKQISLGGQWVLPDFYLCDWDIYIEYFGIVGSRIYREKSLWKKELYARYSKKLIVLEPCLWGKFGAHIRAGFMTYTKQQFPQVKEFPWRK